MARPKRAKSDTPHSEAAFGGAIVGAIAGEVTGAIVAGPPGAIVGGIAGAALGGTAAKKTVEGAPPGDQCPAKPSTAAPNSQSH
jgi:uncharacterized membrane protein